MHSVLDLQAHRPYSQMHKAFEETLGEPRLGRLLAHDHRTQLAVVPHQHHLLGPHDEGDECLGFCCLCGLINQDLSESEIRQTRVPRPHTGRTDDVSSVEKFPLGHVAQGLQSLLVTCVQLPHCLLQLQQPLELLVLRGSQRSNLFVQSQVVHCGGNGLSALGSQTHDLQTAHGDPLCHVVDSHVGGGTHKHLALLLPGEVIHDRGRGHGLSGSRRPLNETERRLEGPLHCIGL
mmetsp:Transcript_23283/g.45808  ORF Transcript_23283/g.45808 Transcript_23283/m.45808 type:complete len:234 (-) Transcript_23283:1097-1798(-)